MAKAKKKIASKAKAKKPASKTKSKPVAKTKKAAAPKKAVKKAAAKKPVKKTAPKATSKKAPAKKAAPKKVSAKKVAPKKVVVAPTPPVVEQKAPVVKKGKPQKIKKSKSTTPVNAVSVKASVDQNRPNLLSIAHTTNFQMPTQRPIAHKPAKPAVVEDRSRYSEEELKEFETLIQQKLEKSRQEYKILKDTLNRNNDEGTDATSGGNTKVLEDGAETAEKENLSQLAARQQKYITNLENALVRIKNGTYGICSVTGKLISKDRLIAVPHTTQSIEAKIMQHD